MVVIRKAGVKDFELVKRLVVELEEDQKRLLPELISLDWLNKSMPIIMGKAIRSNNQAVFLAFDGTKAIGFAYAGKEKNAAYWKVKERAEVYSLYIREEFRSKGIGAKLLKSVCAYFNRKGISWIQLDVLPKNNRAKKFYQKSGFREKLHQMIKIC